MNKFESNMVENKILISMPSHEQIIKNSIFIA